MTIREHIIYWWSAVLLAFDQCVEWCGRHVTSLHDVPTGNWIFDLYRDKKKEYRWRLIATNGKIICVSSESYKTRRSAEESFDLVRDNIKKAIRV